MGTARTVAAGLVFVIFVGALALRSLTAIPGVTAALEDGPSTGLLLWVPLVFVTVAIVWLRVRSSLDDDSDTEWAGKEVQGNHWAVERTGPEIDDETAGEGSDEDGPNHTRDPEETEDRVLGGQGGARDRDFEIEREPPDARLSDHLEHLREELDGREDRTELRTLEEVIEEFEGDQQVPDSCPGEYCDAIWEGRTITGAKSGRYEMLDGGRKVCCLNCEETFRLESAE